jgi:hypothetical protein
MLPTGDFGIVIHTHIRFILPLLLMWLITL